MVINPFWAGVVATILFELAALVVYAVIENRKAKK